MLTNKASDDSMIDDSYIGKDQIILVNNTTTACSCRENMNVGLLHH